MKLSSLLLATIALVGVAAAPTPSKVAGVAANGDHPSYQFRHPVLNGMGVSSLADLQGKPLLVEFWGTH